MTEKEKGKAELLAFLQKLEIFSSLTRADLFQLVESSLIKKVKKGKMIFLEGDPSDKFYIVYSGKIREYVSGFDELELVVKERTEKDFFGEMGILSNENEVVTAIAAIDSILIVIPKAVFLKYISKYSQIVRYLLTVFSKRLQRSAERQMVYFFLDAEAQLAYHILRLNEETKSNHIFISQEELALQCGMVRQTVAKILSKWKRDSWIRTGRGKIEVLDNNFLKHIIYISSIGKDF